MKASKAWQGVRLQWLEASADPDALPVSVLLPVGWGDAAAAATASLGPGRRISLPDFADRWINLAAERAEAADLFSASSLRAALHDLLLRRRAAPGRPLWSDPANATDETAPRFVFNLPAFLDSSAAFDIPAFQDAVEVATVTLALLRPRAPRLALGFADLDGLLAALGLDYDGPPARDVALDIAAIMRGHAECASARLASLTGRSLLPDMWSAPPGQTVVPNLSDAATRAFHAAAALHGCGHDVLVAQTPSDIAEMLLGVETTGIAPAFSRVTAQGKLTRAARHWLAARHLSAEDVVARLLQGEAPLPLGSPEAHAAMHAALQPVLPQLALVQPRRSRRGSAHHAPALSPSAATAMELPTRRSGTMQKAVVGGHRVYLRTAEYEDGKLGEIGISLQKEAPAFRALMDAFATSVSLGLQHGVPLAQFVEAFVGSRFGAAGPVEGDHQVTAASSVLDYVFRHLSAAYLGVELPGPALGELAERSPHGDFEPTLPLEWPQDTPEDRRKRLRLVS